MKRHIITLIALLALTLHANALPARRNVETVLQPDGTQLTIMHRGDEFFHYYTTIDGIALARHADGYFTYAACNDDGTLRATEQMAHNPSLRSDSETGYLTANAVRNPAETARQAAARSSAQAQRVAGSRSADFSTTGEVRIPVLFVQFDGYPATISAEEMQQHFNGSDYTGDHADSHGSVRDYFIAQSDSLFAPRFDVFGPIDLPRPMSYYGKNNTLTDSDLHPGEMVIDACNAIDSLVDFSLYDNSGDGNVEFLYVIYAGYNESYNNVPDTAIWPHQWTLFDATRKTLELDGVKINKYACSGELYGYKGTQIEGIGSICHEFSHCLGLPDFYDTNGINFGMDYWSLMDYGCYNADGFCPIGYSSYEREFLGWMQIETLSEPASVSLRALSRGGEAYRIANPKSKNECYILENRQQNGWDTYIPNHGMLVLHVDYNRLAWENNIVNTNSARQRMTIIPADGSLLKYGQVSQNSYLNGLKGDVWPGTRRNTELTDYSTPAATVYTGDYMGQPITAITEYNGKITFDFMGGTAIELAEADKGVAIAAGEGTLTLAAADGSVAEVYTADGRLQRRATIAGGRLSLSLARNLYIVRVGDKVQKVFVK